MTSDESRLRLADYLSHMLEAVELARGYVTGLSKDDFLKDRRTQQAVILNLITIGDAASRIVSEPKDFATAHPDIPWAQMRGMRNRMAHGYFDIDASCTSCLGRRYCPVGSVGQQWYPQHERGGCNAFSSQPAC